MKWLKRIFITLILIVVLLLGAIVIIGTQYKDEVVDYVKVELGKQLTREVKVGAIEYSLFSNFPNVSVDLINLETYSFEPGDKPFLKLNKVHLVFDISSLIGGEFEVGEVILEEGQVNVIYNKEGIPNFNIFKPSADSTGSKSSFSIDDIQFQNVNVSYADWKAGDEYNVKLTECSVNPKALSDSIDASFDIDGEIPQMQVGDFKSQKPLKLSGNFELWVKNGAVRFDYSGELGEGNSVVKGEIKPGNKSDKWDINCALNGHKAQELLKILPDDFKDPVLNSLKGDLKATLTMKGDKTKKKSPPINIAFEFSNGTFKVNQNQFSKVHLIGDYYQPLTSSIWGAKVKLKSYSADFNGIQVSGKAEVSEFKRPYIYGSIKSDFELANLHELALKEDLESLKGKASLDMTLSGRLKEVFVDKKKSAIKNFKSEGSLVLSEVTAQPLDFDYPIFIKSGALSFDDKNLDLNSFTGNILSSSFEMKGQIKDYLKTVFDNAPLNFDADLKMDKMVLEEFVGDETDSTKSSDNSYQFNLPSSISLNTNQQLGSFTFRKFKANDIKG